MDKDKAGIKQLVIKTYGAAAVNASCCAVPSSCCAPEISAVSLLEAHRQIPLNLPF
jgi:disulfide oxidoreductase YuzD